MGIDYGWNIFISYTKMILSQEIIITTVKLQKKVSWQYTKLYNFTTTVQCKLKLLIPDDNR